MAQYKVRLISEDGEVHEEDDLYDTEEDAYEYGCYLKSCYFQGQEILHMSNPGDNPEPDYDEEIKIEVVEACLLYTSPSPRD